jgi:hypothetical protein
MKEENIYPHPHPQDGIILFITRFKEKYNVVKNLYKQRSFGKL